MIEKAIKLQITSLDNIRTICTNFKKDGAGRKTLEYLEKRISALDAHWQEFQCNHNIIALSDNKDYDYFKEDVYNRTKQMYEETKQIMINMKKELAPAPTGGLPKEVLTPSGLQKFAVAGPSTTSTATPDPSNRNMEANREGQTHFQPAEVDKHKTTDLLRQQRFNFNALQRVVSKINLESMSEKWELEDHLTVLKSKWDSIDKIHWEIDYLLQGSNSNYTTEYNEWEKTYDHYKSEINKRMWANMHYQKSTPKMELPEFNGDYNNWTSFKDLFLETIHTNPLLSKTQKMQYLKSKVKGEAEKLILHLNVSADNYDSCWDIICHRFDNKRLLFSSHINTLLNQSTIQHPNALQIKKLHDTTLECLNAISNIGIDISTWDPLIVHLLLQKLDPATYSDYMHSLEDPRELPEVEGFIKFLESSFMALETLNPAKTGSQGNSSTRKENYFTEQRSSNFNKPNKWTKSYNTTIRNCPLCKSEHVLVNCPTFLEKSVEARNATIAKLRVCKNCLYSHEGRKCDSNKTCKICRKFHHTFLHNPNIKQRMSQDSSTNQTNHVNGKGHEVLLTTVQLMVKDVTGTHVVLRGLLDQGSQVNLITENAAQLLRLPRERNSTVISGIGSSPESSKGKIKMECKSLSSNFIFETEALIMRKLMNDLPNTSVDRTHWSHLDNVRLADPDCHLPGRIDMLLGAEVYAEIIMDGVLKKDQQSPVAQQTKLGWILSGNTKIYNCCVTQDDTKNISRFWEIEDITTEEPSKDDFCEKFYEATTKRLPNGRYVVKMPLTEDISTKLGNSKTQATAQFFQLERKMARQEKLAAQYKLFIKEYTDLGHMKPVTTTETPPPLQSYLSHHGVIRENAASTKLRVVFNASMKTDTKFSLNDCMECGPNLQKDILTLIIKWRTYRYALTADIEKMYRQILIDEEQQSLQKIIWRASPQLPLQEMQLCTVTYGTKAAPFLAMRTLLKLAQDEGHAYPLADKALRNECYMDDLVCGENTLEKTKTLQVQLSELLKKGGFILKKWATNEPSILSDLPCDYKHPHVTINLKQKEAMKALGLAWNTKEDVFCFHWEMADRKGKITKRTLLSDISKIYDPLGWIAPMVIKAKLLFQKLWLTNIAWDDQLPPEIIKEWDQLRADIPNINNVTLPRWITCTTTNVELLGFCDASEKAISCVIFTRTIDDAGERKTTLLAAKTKVAPIKKKITLPRLELEGAVLLCRLMEKVKNALTELQTTIYFWTDSQVVLAWLRGDCSRWDKFVANRTSYINATFPQGKWQYVNTGENPADCATRGLLPSQLVKHKLWWNGPEWLTLTNDVHTPSKYDVIQTDTTQSYVVTKSADHQNCTDSSSAPSTAVIAPKQCVIFDLLQRCSSLTRVIRVMSWVLRIKSKQNTSHLTLNELKDALQRVVKCVQAAEFTEEIKSLAAQGSVSNRSKLLKLTPFTDKKGVLKVGGRLNQSSLPEEMKHPAIIPHTGRLTDLIIQQAHLQTLHGGARLTLAKIRQQFWIIGGNRAVKKAIRQCVKCQRYSPVKTQQLMGNLPEERITPSRPFTHTGVDFTGHVEVKLNKGRGVKTSKGYIAIFICMATKAVHIELVSDLSTPTFIAALKRMCSRRGVPKHMYSDNGTNFVGADRELRREFKAFQTMISTEFFEEVNTLQIEWHFNAPLWPSAGGLWEASVKTMKQHLRIVMGEQKLTYEEFSTLLSQIEACMNSRPLCPLSEDPEDLEYLTPGHFLTGSANLNLPQEDHQDVKKIDMRKRWRVTEMKLQHFWRRWSNEYLHQLQERTKWQRVKENLQTGDLVLVKEANLPPGKWAMGRIIKQHPGKDGLVRVVTIKTKGGELKRPINKLTPLPINRNHQQSTNEPQVTEECKTDELPKQSSRRRRKVSSFLTLLLLSIICLPLTPVSRAENNYNQQYKIIPIEEDRPMYFDEIGNMQLIHDEWNLLVYYNLSSYWQATKGLKKYVDHVDQLCVKAKTQTCLLMTKQLTHEIYQLIDYNNLLMSHHLNRQKRGYFNGVGNLAHTLFGVLDDDFAEKYTQDIENMQTNQKYQLELIKNQTTIIEAENTIVKKNEEFVKNQFQIIKEYMKHSEEQLQTMENRVSKVEILSSANTAAITASFLINSLRKTQEMLMNALTDIYRGHLDMNLFTPDQLSQQLERISSAMSKKLALPIKNLQEDAKELYKLIYVKARLTEQYLLFELHIPLVSDDEYNLYRLIPTTVRKGNIFTTVKETAAYIAVNLIKNTYIEVENHDVSQCMSTKMALMCHGYHPIHNLQGNNTSCAAKLLSQRTHVQCEAKEIPCSDNWIQLHNRNLWLYMCCQECQLRVICEDKFATTAQVSRIGIVVLGQGCIIQRSDITIHSYNSYGSKITMRVNMEIPKIPAPNYMASSDFKNITLQLLDKSYSKEHKDIEKQISDQKKNEHWLNPANLATHSLINYSLTGLLSLLAIITATVWCIRKRCTRTGRQTSPAIVHCHENQGFEMTEINREPAESTKQENRKSRFNFE